MMRRGKGEWVTLSGMYQDVLQYREICMMSPEEIACNEVLKNGIPPRMQ